MPAQKSLEWNCEEVLIQLLRPDSRLAGVELLHHDEEGQAKLDRLIFRAVRRQNQVAGVKGSDMLVTVSFSSSSATSDNLDKVLAAMAERLQSEPLEPLDVPDLSFLSIEETVDGQREDNKVRRRAMEVPMIAKLID